MTSPFYVLRLHIALEKVGWDVGLPMTDLDTGSLVGAYEVSPLREIEYILHEAAHLVVLKEDLNQIAWGEVIEDLLLGLTPEESDRNEIQASYVTYAVGVKLGLWNDPEDIWAATLRNLQLVGKTVEERRKARPKLESDFKALQFCDETTRYINTLLAWLESLTRSSLRLTGL